MNAFKTSFSSAALKQVGQSQYSKLSENLTKKPAEEADTSFAELVGDQINKVDAMQKNADELAVSVSSGKSGNLHEAMLAMSQAELSFNFMVQVRNKALEAYQEIARMQI